MGAYDDMDRGISGLKSGIDSRVESKVAQEEIAFGLPVFGYIGEDGKCWGYKNDVGKIAFDGDFVTGNVITITVNGEAADDVTFTDDHDATMALVLAAVQALTGVDAILDATDTDNRTILIRVKGETAVVAEAITGGAGQVTGTITYGSGQIFLGVAMFDQKMPYSGDAAYDEDDAVNVMVDGWVRGETAVAVSANGTPYVVTTAGANLGKFGTSGEELTGYYTEDVAAAGNAELRVQGQTAMTYGELAFA
jgi:hypothetical protein